MKPCGVCGSRKLRGLFVLEQKTISDKNEELGEGRWYEMVLCMECAEKVEDYMRTLVVEK